VGGMFVAQGILTATGGKTSHAAVVARGWGKCCIVGAEKLDIDYSQKTMKAGEHVVREGDWITLDGNEGAVYEGQVPLVTPELSDSYRTLMSWTDKVRRLLVRTNARRGLASAARSTCSSRISSSPKKASSGSSRFRK